MQIIATDLEILVLNYDIENTPLDFTVELNFSRRRVCFQDY